MGGLKPIYFLLLLLTAFPLRASDNDKLFEAAKTGDETAIRKLLAAGASPDARDEWDEHTALIAAIKGGHPAAVQALIEGGADVNLPDSHKYTSPLIEAVRLAPPRPGIVTMLLKAGAAVDYQEKFKDSSALMHVKSPEIASMLLDAGASVNIRDFWKMTALNWAAVDGNSEVVRLLLEHGAGVSPEINQIMLAAFEGNGEKLNRIVSRGTDINTADEQGWTPLSVASEIGRTEMVKLLLEAGADPNCRYTGWPPFVPPHENFTPLMSAALHGHEKTAEVLIDAGADISARDFYQTPALFHAVRSGSAGVVKLLIQAGAPPEEPHYGRKPLTEAVRIGYTDVALVLLEAGADTEEAYELAKEQGKTEIIELMEKYKR